MERQKARRKHSRGLKWGRDLEGMEPYFAFKKRSCCRISADKEAVE